MCNAGLSCCCGMPGVMLTCVCCALTEALGAEGAGGWGIGLWTCEERHCQVSGVRAPLSGVKREGGAVVQRVVSRCRELCRGAESCVVVQREERLHEGVDGKAITPANVVNRHAAGCDHPVPWRDKTTWLATGWKRMTPVPITVSKWCSSAESLPSVSCFAAPRGSRA